MTDSIACTIVARNYLPAARVLADSYLRHHPDGRFVILLVDANPGELAELAEAHTGNAAIRLADPDELPLPRAEFRRMATAYTVTELCTAVKPSLLRKLLTTHDVAIYLDPDIEVFSAFGEVAELAEQHGIVLTPHVLEPMPRDGLRPSEADIMASGVFNLGFLAVSTKGADFLDFWAERLRQDAISAPAEQLFTDQRWVDNVPPLFGHTVLADPGFNVAYWNVYQRPLRKTAPGEYTVDALRTSEPRPLRFYHFSGYRPEKPWLLSTHFADRPRVLLSENPVLSELCASYRTKLLAAGYAESLDAIPYRWNELPDGTHLSPSLRRVYRQAWVDADRNGEAPPPNPFDDTEEPLAGSSIDPEEPLAGSSIATEEPLAGSSTDTEKPDAFLRWATSPADPMQAAAGFNRWAMAVWHNRADLRSAFRDPLGADAEAFREWCATSGISEGTLHPAAVPTGPARTRHVPVRDTLGVNMLGYLTAELGVGEMGRRVHDALRESGLPLATTVEEKSVVNRTDHPFAATKTAHPAEFPVSVLCVNADMTPGTLRMYPELAEDRYVIGVWSWELDEFPEWMHEAFTRVDEVWTISEFCREALAKHSPVPVHTFPVPVPPAPEVGTAAAKKSGRTRFLFAFDFNSMFGRKNPLGLITAFRQAFPGGDEPVELVIKSINGDRHAALRERLRAAAAEDERIDLAEGYLGHDEVAALFASADCYVSLHRSEGFGLTVAEAMAFGLPVIATDYSGSAEFFTSVAGWPVPVTMVPVGLEQHPYPPDGRWAEPDLGVAAEAMRAVVADPEQAAERGRAGRELLLRNRSMTQASEWVRRRVTAARESWRQRQTAEPDSPIPAGPLQPLRESREALRWRPNTGSPSRLPITPALRRGVLRVIDHYDVHQRKVLGAVVDGAEGSLARVDARIDALTARLANQPDLTEVRRQLAAVSGELDELRAAAGQDVDNEAAQRFQQDEALAGRLDELTEQLGDTARSGDELDGKLVGMITERDRYHDERDRRLAELERANGELRQGLDAVRTSLQRHHELLDPARSDGDPATASIAVPTDVGLLRLPGDDTVVLPWLQTYGTWEESESALVEQLLPAGGTFVDIGAHVGYYTVRALRKVGPTGAVIAVEPWQRVRDLLDHNVRANVPPAEAGALTVVAGAAWDADGPLKLALDPDGNSGDNRIGSQGEIEVRGLRLDGLAALRDRTVSLVKVDAQGRDHKALAGMAELLVRDHPQVICEYWPQGIEELGEDPEAVLAQYRAWGYRPLPVTEHGPAVRSSKDTTLVRSARKADGGFLTLWLKPL